MSDRMIIVGKDKKPKYEVTGPTVVDLQEYCVCTDEDIPILTVHPPLCSRCRLRIKPESNSYRG